MTQRKHSRQRDAIKAFLTSRTDHPTADMIYTCLREDYPNISLGTVYRNLTLLTELGEVARISTGDGADHYDANTSQHHHFICSVCQNIYDLQIDAMDSIDSVIGRATAHCQGRIDHYRINFYGTCARCLKGHPEHHSQPAE